MKIKEVEDMLCMNSQTIRYYDKLGFLHPSRDDNGYRNYSMEDISILKKIRFLRELDISLDNIERILNNQDEFQSILDQHIRMLQVQVENLEDVQQKCKELSEKSIPLLDAVVDGKFQDMNPHDNNQMNHFIKKAVEFMKPYPVITIGKKTTPYQFLKDILLMFCCVAFVGAAILIRMNDELNWMIYIIGVLVACFICAMILFKEKFYEFKDVDFYVFDSHHQKIRSMIAIFKNTTLHYAKHYSYQDIDHVAIRIEKRYGGIGFGVEKYFKIIFKFIIKNGEQFEIDTSFYNKIDQDRKSVYEILEYHHVPIIDKQNLKEAIQQTELSLYDYLDKVL